MTLKAADSAQDNPPTFWQRYSADGLQLLAAIVLLFLILAAALAPFLAEERPLILPSDAGWSLPLSAAFGVREWIWLAAFLSVSAWLLATKWKKNFWIGAGVGSTVFAALALYGGLQQEINDPRPYREELGWRQELALLDQHLMESRDQTLLRKDLEDLMRNASAWYPLAMEIDQRLHHLEEETAETRTQLTLLAADNRRVATHLSRAVFPIHPSAPDRVLPHKRRLKPGDHPDHPFGTDSFGRDVLAITIHGTRTALETALPAVLIAALLSIVIGGAAGYFGSWVDFILSRIMEVFACVPALLAMVLSSAFLPSGSLTLILVLGLLLWPYGARLVRNEVQRLKSEAFVTASVLAGRPGWYILFFHILPHAVAPLFVVCALEIGAVVLAESSLTFLGLGDSNLISWGHLIRDARADPAGLWHTALFPGFATFILIYALNIAADGLRRVTR